MVTGSLRNVKSVKPNGNWIGSLRNVKSVKPNGNWKPKKLKVLNLIRWKMWKVLTVSLRSGRVLGN